MPDSIDCLDNYDADRHEPPEAFYTEGQPCESCGAPTFLERVWNAEHELWIAQDCSCNAPDVPLPACMIRVLDAAQTVGQLCDSVKAHRKSCPVCSGVVEIRQGAYLTASTPRQAAVPKDAADSSSIPTLTGGNCAVSVEDIQSGVAPVLPDKVDAVKSVEFPKVKQVEREAA